MTDLSPSPAARGYAPATDHLGYALSDIKDPPPQGVSLPVATFTAWDRASGALVTVDDRTFSDALHSLAPLTPEAP